MNRNGREQWSRWKENLSRAGRMYFQGRNGLDALSGVILLVSLLCSVAARITGLRLLDWLYTAGMLLALYRTFSRKVWERQKENQKLLQWIGSVKAGMTVRKNIFLHRKTHRYFRCPACKLWLRAPRNKGKISVRCSRCGEQFIRMV